MRSQMKMKYLFEKSWSGTVADVCRSFGNFVQHWLHFSYCERCRSTMYEIFFDDIQNQEMNENSEVNYRTVKKKKIELDQTLTLLSYDIPNSASRY